LSRNVGLTFLFFCLGLCIVACSGGSTGSTPEPAQTIGGSGFTGPLNATASFEIAIPPAATKAAAARRRPGDNVYVSPNTGSISIAIAAVNGLSVQQPPPASVLVVPASCIGAKGCQLLLSNVPAAVGADQYVVTTNAGKTAESPVISIGTVDVTVTAAGPNKAAVNDPARLTVGGFVASVSVVVPTLVEGKAQTVAVDVQALDAAGAVIIGDTEFAYPITLTSNDDVNFALREIGSPSTISLSKPETPGQISLAYSGSGFGAVLTATSAASDAIPFSKTFPVNVTIPATPTPVPSAAPPSLYVVNGFDNSISEFAPATPKPVFRRAFGGSTVGCAPSFVSNSSAGGFFVTGLYGVAIAATGDLLVGNGTCKQSGAASAVQIDDFAPSAAGTTPPAATYTDGTKTIQLLSFLETDPTTRHELTDGSTGNATFIGLALNGKAIDIASTFGTGNTASSAYGCFAPSLTATCTSDSIGFSGAAGASPVLALEDIVTDAAGNGYTVSVDPVTGLDVLIELPAQSLLSSEGLTVLIAPGYVPLAPFQTVQSLAVDGSVIYLLNTADRTSAGYCAPTPASTAGDLCADGDKHEYITAYNLAEFTSGSGARTVAPILTLGGDRSRFEGFQTENNASSALTQRLAAHDGKLYVANIFGGDCSASTDPLCYRYFNSNGAPVQADGGEVDVYDDTLRGYHVNDQLPSAAAGTLIAGPNVKSPTAVTFAPAGSDKPAAEVRQMPQGRYSRATIQILRSARDRHALAGGH